MRILFLSNFFPPASLGGYEQWCHEVANALRDSGHEVAVLTSDFKRAILSKPDPEWVSRKLHLEMEIASWANAFQFFTSRKSRELENLEMLRQIVHEFSPEVSLVWGMWNLHRSLPALLEKLMPGRVVYYLSDYWPALPNQFENYWNAPPHSKISGFPKVLLKSLALQILAEEVPAILKFEHVVCCSKYVRDHLVTAGQVPPHAEVLLGGIDPTPFLRGSLSQTKPGDAQTHKLHLLYYGRLIPDKGVHTAVQALGLLKQRGQASNLELTILGKGPANYEAKLHQMVSDLGINENVSFFGPVPRDEIPKWLAQFDVYLFTSIWPEPMARSVMEAMAAGLLVIGTKVGGQAEMLAADENALTFEPDNAEALADQISRVACDPQLRARLAQAGHRLAIDQFTLERMVDQIERLLQNVASAVTSTTGI